MEGRVTGRALYRGKKRHGDVVLGATAELVCYGLRKNVPAKSAISMPTTTQIKKKKHVDIHGMDAVVQELLPEKYQTQYEALDALHMNCLRDYVHEHITYKKGEKPRTKKRLIDDLIKVVTEHHGRINQTTRKYAKDSLAACDQLLQLNDTMCSKRRRNYHVSNRLKTRSQLKKQERCQRSDAARHSESFAKMRKNVERLSRCNAREFDCPTDNNITAAGDIGNFLSTCKGISCSSYAKRPTGGLCKN